MRQDGMPVHRRYEHLLGIGVQAGQAEIVSSNAGQGLVEYVLLLALAAAVIVGGATFLGSGLTESYDQIVDSLGGIPQPTTAPGQPTPTPAGPTQVTVRVVDDSGTGLSSVPISAFLDTEDHYTGLTQTTNASGQATFSLPAGTYLFRGDHLGQAYWSDPLATPAGTTTTILVSLCQTISLGEVTFPSRGSPLDGLLVIVRVNNDSGQEMDITQVTIDWDYLRGLPEEPAGKIRVYGAYLCPGSNPNCSLGNRRRFFNNISPGWGTDLDVTTSPTTASKNRQTLPTSGGYIGFDFDSKDYMDRRSLSGAPWYLVADDFGFQVSIEGCPNPLTRSAVSR